MNTGTRVGGLKRVRSHPRTPLGPMRGHLSGSEHEKKQRHAKHAGVPTQLDSVRHCQDQGDLVKRVGQGISAAADLDGHPLDAGQVPDLGLSDLLWFAQ
jgi:hypothetical protein